jgi:hypothetical protein
MQVLIEAVHALTMAEQDQLLRAAGKPLLHPRTSTPRAAPKN